MSGVRIGKVNGRGVYVAGNDIDTDRIIKLYIKYVQIFY